MESTYFEYALSINDTLINDYHKVIFYKNDYDSIELQAYIFSDTTQFIQIPEKKDSIARKRYFYELTYVDITVQSKLVLDIKDYRMQLDNLKAYIDAPYNVLWVNYSYHPTTKVFNEIHNRRLFFKDEIDRYDYNMLVWSDTYIYEPFVDARLFFLNQRLIK